MQVILFYQTIEHGGDEQVKTVHTHSPCALPESLLCTDNGHRMGLQPEPA